jgi:hypothetical protein
MKRWLNLTSPARPEATLPSTEPGFFNAICAERPLIMRTNFAISKSRHRTAH